MKRNIIKIISATFLIVIGIICGIFISKSSPSLLSEINFSTPLVKPTVLPTLLPTITIDIVEVKKQELTKFYNDISTAQENQDWSTIYDLAVPKFVKDNISKDQFITNQKMSANKDKIVSQNTIVNSVVVNGDDGIVDRTIVTCKTQECTGNNRKVDNAKKQYVYVNGKWQMPDPKPSEKALTASSYIYMNVSATDQKKFISDYGYGSNSTTFAINNFALFLDQYPDNLAITEAWIDKNKAERSRPVVNYQPPAINYQPPAIIQQPQNPINCTSNTIGNYTYTNCF